MLSAIVLAALVAVVGLGLVAHPLPTVPKVSKHRDLQLYAHIIEAVHNGGDYYAVAIQAHRQEGYPVRPFVTVRPPTLAVAMAALPDAAARVLSLRILAAITFTAWILRLIALQSRPLAFGGSILLLASGILPSFAAPAYLLHEYWAGLLIALSLALRGPRLWPLAVLAGLAACAVRELAGAYLLAMATLALKDGRRGEAGAWIGAILVFACGLSLHAAAVGALVRPSDLASPGWLAHAGWPFVLACLRWNAPLILAPTWLMAVIAPLAFLGLAAQLDPLGERVALTVWGYAAAFLLVGRPENFYWGVLIAPFWPLGLVTAWPALHELWRGLGRGGSIHTHRPA